MHRTKAGTMGRAGMLAAIAALVALVAMLPMFGRPGPAYAAGLDLDYTSAYSEFIIPGVLGTTLADKFPPPETHELLKDAGCELAMPDMPIADVPNPKGEDRPLNGTADWWQCAPSEPFLPFNRFDFHTGGAQDNLRIGGVVAQCLLPDIRPPALGQWKKTIGGVEAWGVDFSVPCENGPTPLLPALDVWLLDYAEANCTLEKQDVNAPGKPATPTATPPPAPTPRPPQGQKPGEYDRWKCAPKITNPYAQDATFATESAQIQVADPPQLANVVFECPATGEVVNVLAPKVPGIWQSNFGTTCKGGFDVYTKAIVPGTKADIVNAYALFPASNAPVNNGLFTMIAHNPGPYVMSLNSPVAGIFPATGELLLGKTELVVYNTTSPCGLTPLGPNDVCVTTRAKVGEIKQHEPGTKVKLATQLTSGITVDASNVAQTTLVQRIAVQDGDCTPIGPPPYENNQGKCPVGGSGIDPFIITIADGTNFPVSGDITISHQEVQTANLMGSGNATEYMHYDNTDTTALTYLADKVQNRANQPPPFKMTVVSTAGFAKSGTLYVDNEKFTYDQNALQGTGEACENLIALIQFCITGREDPGAQHNPGAPVDPCVGGQSSYPFSGETKLCVQKRSQQSNNQAHSHDANGFAQPGHHDGVSIVDLHFQIDVKSNEGFFPAGNLLVYNVDETNNIAGAELMEYNNAAPKVKTPSATQFHMVTRGAAASTFKKTAVVQHKTGSIVTGPDTYVVCRNGNAQPGVDTDLIEPGIQEPPAQVPGTSVGLVLVCYTQSQPNGPPKTLEPKDAKQLHVPLDSDPAGFVGRMPLLAWTSIPGQPFLSTGGFTHVIEGPVEHIDADGTAGDEGDLDNDGNTTESILGLVSPCVLDNTPGVNLRVRLYLEMDKDYATPDSGEIQVTQDWFHDDNETGNPADDCDDPAGTDVIRNVTYYWDADQNQTDDDTDGDGCSDVEELSSYYFMGGVRDPWNPYDFYDVNGDSYIDLFNDILGVIRAHTGSGGYYDKAADRGALLYGPFGWNLSQPDGTIDLFNDILNVINQYQHDCRPPP